MFFCCLNYVCLPVGFLSIQIYIYIKFIVYIYILHKVFWSYLPVRSGSLRLVNLI